MSSLLPPSFDLQDGDKNGLRVFRGLPPQAGCPACCYSVVVNADDLGYCDERDRGIVEAFKGGVVTSTSLLVNGASAESGAQRALAARRPAPSQGVRGAQGELQGARAREMSIGLHFNLTEGCAVSDGAALPGKLGFWDVQQARGLLPNRPPTQQQQQQGGGEGKGDGRVADKGWVAQELLAQLARFRLLVGRYPSHVDGHNHVHVCPMVAEVLCEELPRLGVRWTRVPRENLSGFNYSSPLQKSFYSLIRKCADTASALFEKHELRFARHFVGYRSCLTPAHFTKSVYSVLDQLQYPQTTSTSSNPTSPHSHLHSHSHSKSQLSANSSPASTRAPSATAPSALGGGGGGGDEEITMEFMVHPGYSQTRGGGDLFSQSLDRCLEKNTLTSPQAAETLRTCAFKLVPYPPPSSPPPALLLRQL